MCGTADKDNDEPIARQELLKLGPLLWLDQIQAGDVMLTRGGSKEAAKIASLSAGEFSHAGMWLPGPPSEMSKAAQTDLQLVESDDAGVGPSFLPYVLVFLPDGSSRKAVYLPQRVEKIELRRHPKWGEVNRDALSKAIGAIESKEFYKRYPDWGRLVGASDFHPLLKRLLSSLLDTGPKSPHEGLFCSELVVAIYEEIGLPLFRTELAASDVSPNHFARKECLLEPVDAFLNLRSLDEKAVAYHSGSNSFSATWRERMLSAAVKGQGTYLDLSAKLDGMDAYTRQLSQKNAQDLRVTLEEGLNVARRNLILANSIGKEGFKANAAKAFLSCLYAYNVSNELVRISNSVVENPNYSDRMVHRFLSDFLNRFAVKASHDTYRNLVKNSLQAHKHGSHKPAMSRSRLVKEWRKFRSRNAPPGSKLDQILRWQGETSAERAAYQVKAMEILELAWRKTEAGLSQT